MTAKKKSTCFEALKHRILTLELAPGQALDETIISRQFGISRTPLREVLQRLSGLGYVTLERNRGAAVSPMDLNMMRAFFRTAPMIYSVMARLAAENSVPGDITELRQIQGDFRAAVEGAVPEEMVLHNHRFHEAIGRAARNAYLMPSLNRLLIDHTRMSQTFYRPRFNEERGRIADACGHHDALIDAIERHEAARAVEITQAHWDLSRHQIDLYIRPDPLDAGMAEEKETSRHAI